MPFIYAGVRLLPAKFDKIKLHDISYENTTGWSLKELILSHLLKKSEDVSNTETKEKKFKADSPSDGSDQREPITNPYLSEGFCPEEIDLVYCGKILDDKKPIHTYNVKDYVMVHVFAKERFVLGKNKEKSPPVAEPEQALDVTYINSLVFQFQRLSCSPSFGKGVLKKLRKPENMKKILTICPALKNDPVALAIIKEPELLLQINNIETVTKIAKNHPALARCVSDLVDILFEEVYNSITPPTSSPAGPSSSLNSITSPYLSGDEDIDMPSAGEASAVSRITPAQVAAALQSASGSSSSVPQSPAITPEYVNSTMMQIMSNLSTPGTASSSGSAPSTSVTSPVVTTTVNPMEQYASQIQQMRELGVTDEVAMIEALQLTNGEVQAALNLVFGL